MKKGVDVGGPGEFGVESDFKQFNLVRGSDGRVIEVERELGRISVGAREDYELGFLRSDGETKRVEVRADSIETVLENGDAV